MEKILGLLHEGTIVDLKVFYQLIKRYKLHLFFAVLFFSAFFAYNFYTQPIIYAVTVPVKVVTNHKVSTDLSSLLPADNANLVTLEELNISIASLTFLKNLAEFVIDNPSFEYLNFGNINSRTPLLGKELKKLCTGNRNCLINQLTGTLKGLFFIEQGMVENRFNLVANAIDKKTASALASRLVAAMELDRVKSRQYMVLKEIKSVGSLIEESRSVMQKMGGYKALEEQEKLQNNISDLKESIKMLQYNTSLEISNGTSLQAKLSENKKSSKTSEASREKYEAYQKIQVRLNDIKLNLNNLSHLTEENRSASDKAIITQLLAERSRILKSMPVGKNFNSMQVSEAFKEKQREVFGNVEFDYLVSKNKIAKLNEEYENSKAELNMLMQNKLANEMKVNGMKSDLDFLRNLESKQMSLKLLNATMNSDLIFEDANQVVGEFRKSSFYKILFFSFSVSVFLYLFSIILRYSLDDKIYGEEEIRLYFKELDFVGEVPSFL